MMCEVRTQTEGHALPDDVLLLRPAGDPAGVGVVEVDICLEDIAEGIVVHEMLQSEKVAVPSSVCGCFRQH